MAPRLGCGAIARAGSLRCRVRPLLEARRRGCEVGAATGWVPSARAQWQGSERNEESASQRLRESRDPKPGCAGAGSASRLPKRATAPVTSKSPQVPRGGDVREEKRASRPHDVCANVNRIGYARRASAATQPRTRKAWSQPMAATTQHSDSRARQRTRPYGDSRRID